MADVSVRLPTMLATLVKGDRIVPVTAVTVREALESLFAVHPELRVHILDERHLMRPHVSCFHNDTMLHGDGLEEPVSDGDTVTIMQAVSGG